MLIFPPAKTVLEAGFSSEVVDAKVAPTGIIAVAPVRSTQTVAPGS
jgi:hypothetical protein